MKLLGLDFDNTLVRYDELFHQLALEKKLICKDIPKNKTSIRNHLRAKNMDEEFTLLQGEVYGSRILEAKPAEGVIQKLKELKKLGIQMKIISHKTKYPYRGPKKDLRGAALQWLEKHSFFSEESIGLTKEDVFFESTKEEKIERIKFLECSIYIDDLPEILEMIPNHIKKVLYNPGKIPYSGENIEHWSKLMV